MAVGILIVNYRSYPALAQCLASCAQQVDAADEIVVVDHASDALQLDAVLAGHPRVVRVVRPDNPGFAAGVNRAARHTRADMLLLLNPDTVFEGSVLREMERWLRDHRHAGAVGPRILNADGSVQPSARAFPGWSTALGGRTTWLTRRFPNNVFSRRNLIGRQATRPVDVDWISGACLMTPRALFESQGGLDESFFLYWEDADYCHRLRHAGRACTYLPDLVVRHAGGASAAADPAGAIRAFHSSAFRLYRKHAGPVGRLFSPFVRVALLARGEWRARSAVSARRLS